MAKGSEVAGVVETPGILAIRNDVINIRCCNVTAFSLTVNAQGMLGEYKTALGMLALVIQPFIRIRLIQHARKALFR